MSLISSAIFQKEKLIECAEDDLQTILRLRVPFSNLMMKRPPFLFDHDGSSPQKTNNYYTVIFDFERDIFEKKNFRNCISVRSFAGSVLRTERNKHWTFSYLMTRAQNDPGRPMALTV
jgi:hypothetical protein